MGRIIWTQEAVTWLEEIHAYIARDIPSAAHRVLTGIYEKVQLLREFPRAGHVRRRVPEGELRIISYAHYRIAYMLHADETVVILGVFHGALDIDRYL